MWHLQDSKVIRSSQHGFKKHRYYLGKLIFYDKVACLVDERKAMNVVYLNFTKTIGTVSYSILLE